MLSYRLDEEARTNPYTGYHNRRFADSNGYYYFEVFTRDGQWYWSAINVHDEHVGATEGPFNTARSAYYNAIKGE